MKKIDINIDKAVLTAVSLRELEKETPQVTGHLDLYAGSNKVTSITLSSDDWNDKKKFKVPFRLFEPIGKIAKELEKIVTNQFKAALAELPPAKDKEI